MTDSTPHRLLPTGTCWCGCGTTTSTGAFFARGHDKAAEAALLAARYESSVARLLDHHGFGPGRSVLDAAIERGGWETCRHCDYVGAPASIHNHTRKYHDKED